MVFGTDTVVNQGAAGTELSPTKIPKTEISFGYTARQISSASWERSAMYGTQDY